MSFIGKNPESPGAGFEPLSNGGHGFSRRDFLKWTVAMASGSLVTACAPSLASQDGIPFDAIGSYDGERATQNFGKRVEGVSREYIKALRSKDPVQLEQAKKLAILAVFAESASRLGQYANYPISSTLIYHYLNGSGETVDLSSKLIEQDHLFPSYIEGAVAEMKGEKLSNIPNETLKCSLGNLRQFRKQATASSGVSYSYAVENWGDFGVYSLGGHNVKLNCHEVNWESDNESPTKFRVDVTTPRFEIYDRYQFGGAKKETSIYLAGHLRSFLAGLTPQQISETIEDFVSSINSSGLPTATIDMIVEGVQYVRYGWADDIQALVVGDMVITEEDMSLLEDKLSAKQFDITGSVTYDGTISIEVDVE